MPELPEVETIRRALAKYLPGQRMERILVRDGRLRWPVDATRLGQLLIGERIQAVERRAKYLLIRFERDTTLLIHLGMSGRLLWLTESPPFEKHDHVIFTLAGGAELRFRDPRRFGMVDAIAPGALGTYPRLRNLGLEPLARTTRATPLFERARRRHRPIKNLLMDASFMVGVGNIYASEALFHARIHPARAAGSLSREEWQSVLGSVRGVLRKAIRKGGTTLNDFVNSNGETGYFQLSLAVYGREDQPCPKCGTPVERFVQVGRSSFFCPVCQPSHT
ncbi:MAG: bifunctional DNA-formamidopyrimidine glycosylase/DNA-(apurinic or apyrimidinic site) lyase [bacterium]